jgi:hypothetical protein
MGTDLVVWRKSPINPRKRPQKLRTICEVLRELYREAEARGDALSMNKIDEAHDMAKRMDRRLRELSPREPYIVSEKQ